LQFLRIPSEFLHRPMQRGSDKVLFVHERSGLRQRRSGKCCGP
jgi:hypothetical protein